MFTGIVQDVAVVEQLLDREGLRSFLLRFGSPAMTDRLAVGASVAVDGVCLTVTQVHDASSAWFDVMQQSLDLTTLSALSEGSRINVERAALANAEVGGHPLSGHVDAQVRLQQVSQPANNHVLRLAVPAPWMRYLFAKGYVAVNGASLTIAQAHREADGSGWFEVWLIPETLRMTTFADKRVGDALNLEIDRATQVIVDTVRDAVQEKLGAMAPLLEAWLADRGQSLADGLTTRSTLLG
jgi:riboflavin synthase